VETAPIATNTPNSTTASSRIDRRRASSSIQTIAASARHRMSTVMELTRRIHQRFLPEVNVGFDKPPV
jgi:hypothetical protein